MSSKPFGVCWCDCHRPIDEEGRRLFDGLNDAMHVNGWPKFDAPTALATACNSCRRDHTLFVEHGRDWLYPGSYRGTPGGANG